jgi:hypothetical protein
LQWHIDSAAIGTWHIGGHSDNRAIKCLDTKGIKTSHIVRQVNYKCPKLWLIIWKYQYCVVSNCFKGKALIEQARNRQSHLAPHNLFLVTSYHVTNLKKGYDYIVMISKTCSTLKP